jgi:uncharacterized protein YehS (DUF1456 family)
MFVECNTIAYRRLKILLFKEIIQRYYSQRLLLALLIVYKKRGIHFFLCNKDVHKLFRGKKIIIIYIKLSKILRDETQKDYEEKGKLS